METTTAHGISHGYNPRGIEDTNGKMHQLENIIFFRDGAILLDIGRGWIEQGSERVDTFTIDTPRPARKVDYSRRESFITTGSRAYSFDKSDVLHIYADGERVTVEDEGEALQWENNTQRAYAHTYNITMPGMTGERMRLKDGLTPGPERTRDDLEWRREAVESVRVVSGYRFEPTDFGAEVKRVEDDLKEAGIDVRGYALEKLMERYTLTRKED